MSNPKFNYAAAYGITAATAASWSLTLERTPRVLVPIALQVLMVRKGSGASWADIGMRVPTVDPGKTVEAAGMMPDPFTDREPRRNGAYLMWVLPDALTKATVDDQNAAFPAIPDRWLVLRICPSQTHSGKRTVVGWVLQAGDPTPQVFDLKTWKEPGKPSTAKKPLTAMGHGETAWAAVLDNTFQRLAFYDSLVDCPNGPIAYAVIGWYSDGSLDPLGDPNIHSLADFDAKMREMGWSWQDEQLKEVIRPKLEYVAAAQQIGLDVQLSASAQSRAQLPFDTQAFQKPLPGSVPDGPPWVTDGSWWPQGSLYHGYCFAIGWPGVGWTGNEKGLLSQEAGGPPAAGKINVAIGNTTAEALAVLVGNATGSDKQARILEAFQQGMLTELDQPDGRARLDARLRSSAFGSISGGSVPDRVWQAATGPVPGPPAHPADPAPGVFSRYLDRTRRAVQVTGQNANLKKTRSAPLNANVLSAKAFQQESRVMSGNLSQILNVVNPVPQEPYVPGQWVDTTRALPRYFYPTDPVVLMQGVSRSFLMGNDGRYSADGTLQCRLSGMCHHSYAKVEGDITLPPIYPADVLDTSIDNGSVPPECNEILGEAAIMDPGTAEAMVTAAAPSIPNFTPTLHALAVQQVIGDQTAVHALRDPRVDSSAVIAHSGFDGMLPSPVSIGLPTNPWSPVYLEWQVQFTPSPSPMDDWELGETDFNESPPKAPGQTAPLTFSGRCTVNEGASQTAAKAVRAAAEQIQNAGGTAQLPAKGQEQAISLLAFTLNAALAQLQISAQNVPDGDRSALEDIATSLESMDVLGATFNKFHLALRGGFFPDGKSAPNAGDPKPNPFFLMRAGFLKIQRLRLVDGFGQFLDLAGSSKSTPADPKKLLLADTLQIPDQPGIVGLPPRFTAPTRLWLRFKDAAGSKDATGQINDASLATDKIPGLSPICGYIMPNHLDAALEFFSADGSNIGMIRPADDNSIVWEGAPGTAATVGSVPSIAIADPHLGAMGDALVRWGIADAGVVNEQDNALQALMRVIDSTLWSVDPFGHTGDEHLSLLVGHPVAMMRASLRLDVQEPVDPENVKLMEVPVRLGALAHWQDGLLGYFVNDDYTTLYCSDAAAAGLARAIGPGLGFLQQVNLVPDYYAGFASADAPVKHPYINTSGVMWIHPGQEINLTLLVEPFTLVHATGGFVPRKEIGMRREWVTAALAKIAPTFRFGPVLIDPKKVRMPIAAELNGTWTWDHRQDVITWESDPVTQANQDATLAPDPPVGSEGWLRLGPPEPKGGNA